MKGLLASGKSKAASCGEATPIGTKGRRRTGNVGSFRKLAQLDCRNTDRKTPLGASLAVAGPASACMETEQVPETATKINDNLLNRSIVGQMTAGQGHPASQHASRTGSPAMQAPSSSVSSSVNPSSR